MVASPPSPPTVVPAHIGGAVIRSLSIAYRARIAPLLIGPPGIGKSELLVQLARVLGIDIRVVDLSLCEPSDLVGLPHREGGRTAFAPPSWLPADGAGIIVFEELNRADRFIQGPVLQLLTARRLNDYVLPPGWSCAAAINPDDGHNDVRPLDAAMMSRFLVLHVDADRREWLAWARCNGVHPAIVHVVGADATSLAQVAPRSWKFASDLLLAMDAGERTDGDLLHRTLAGVLPEPWVVVVGNALVRLHDGDLIAVDILRRIGADPRLRERLQDLRDRGRTDVLRALANDLRELLAEADDLSRLAAQKDFTFENFELVLDALPGDLRRPLQDALAGNAFAPRLLGLDFAAIMACGYPGHGLDRSLALWQREDRLQHRARLFVAGLCNHLRVDAHLPMIRRLPSIRHVLGYVLTDLQPPLREPLLACLASLKLEPILPDRRKP